MLNLLITSPEWLFFVLKIQDVYQTTYETCGQYWPHIHNYIVIAIVLMQVTMIGLFGLKSKPTATILTVPLLMLTLLFNEYCKICYRPTFYRYSVQVSIFLCSLMVVKVSRCYNKLNNWLMLVGLVQIQTCKNCDVFPSKQTCCWASVLMVWHNILTDVCLFLECYGAWWSWCKGRYNGSQQGGGNQKL